MRPHEQALAALSDPTRRRILEQLRTGPTSVGDLAAGLPVSRPAVSQHLAILRAAGLVSERREGTRRIYSAEPGGFVELRRWIERFWSDVLAAYERAAHEHAAAGGKAAAGEQAGPGAVDHPAADTGGSR